MGIVHGQIKIGVFPGLGYWGFVGDVIPLFKGWCSSRALFKSAPFPDLKLLKQVDVGWCWKMKFQFLLHFSLLDIRFGRSQWSNIKLQRRKSFATTCRFASIWQQKNNRALKYSTWIVCPAPSEDDMCNQWLGVCNRCNPGKSGSCLYVSNVIP